MDLKTSLGSLCFSLGMVTKFTSRPMHGDWCLTVSGSYTQKSGARKPYSEQHPSRMCVHRAHNLLVLRSPQLSFTLRLRSLCRHKSVLAICMCLSYKQRVGNIISENIGPAIAGSARPALPALSERNGCVKETVPLKLFKVQSSNFKKLMKKVG